MSLPMAEGLEQNDLWGPFKPKWFCDSMILWFFILEILLEFKSSLVLLFSMSSKSGGGFFLNFILLFKYSKAMFSKGKKRVRKKCGCSSEIEPIHFCLVIYHFNLMLLYYFSCAWFSDWVQIRSCYNNMMIHTMPATICPDLFFYHDDLDVFGGDFCLFSDRPRHYFSAVICVGLPGLEMVTPELV